MRSITSYHAGRARVLGGTKPVPELSIEKRKRKQEAWAAIGGRHNESHRALPVFRGVVSRNEIHERRCRNCVGTGWQRERRCEWVDDEIENDKTIHRCGWFGEELIKNRRVPDCSRPGEIVDRKQPDENE